MHVFGQWEEAGVPRGNPCEHEENTQFVQQTPAIKMVNKMFFGLNTLKKTSIHINTNRQAAQQTPSSFTS